MKLNSKLLTRSPRRSVRRFGWILAIAGAALFLTFVASASADSILCSDGSGAGQCGRPQGVAIDRSNGHVYVADVRNNRIDVFGSNDIFLFAFGYGVADGVTNAPQTCTTTCFRGIAGPGAGQQDLGEAAIAIDNDPASPSYRDLYVAERNNARIQKFTPDGSFIYMLGGGVNKTTGKNLCPEAPGDVCGVGAAGGGDGEFSVLGIRPAVGPGGALLVADMARSDGQEFNAARVQSFEPSGSFVARLVLLKEASSVRGLAFDSSGDFYLGLGASVQKYDPSGTEIKSGAFPLTVTYPNSLATDGADNLFVAENAGIEAITKYDSAGNILSRFGYGSMREGPSGIAPTASGDVYGTETFAERAQLLSAPLPGPISCCLQAARGNTEATLKGRVNPENKATTYHFDYLDDAGFKAGGFSNPGVKRTPDTSAGSDFELHSAEAQIGCANPPQPSCLEPATLYHYRLVATSEDGTNSVEGQFETLPPFEIEGPWATEVTTDAARLHVAVNPFGIPATGYFEYVEDATYEADVGEGGDGFGEARKLPDVDNGRAPIDFGGGEAPKTASAELSSLTPGATYHYRFVASDSFVSKASPERTITTFSMPSPSANACPNEAFRFGPSAALPDCRAYEMVSPVDKNGGEIRVLGSTLNYPARLEESSADGDRYAFSSVTAFGDAVSAPWTSEYIATRHQGEGWSTHAISPARESGSLTLTPAFKFDVQYKAFSEDLANGWLIHDTNPPLDECAPEGVINLYRRDNATGKYEALTIAKPTSISSGGYELELQGLSADQAHAVFRANGTMSTTSGPLPSKAGLSQVYMHVKDPDGGCGELRLVSVLPNGKASALDSSLGVFLGLPGESRDNAVSHAVSADGSRVFWSARNGGTRTIYLRDMVSEKTVQVAASGLPGTNFWTATPDGSKALYTVGEELYEFDTDKALVGEPASTLISTGVPGVVATSEDLSRIYFVSSETLGGEGKAGKPNLYLREGGTTTLIATLFGGDASLPSGDLNVKYPHHGFALAQPNPIANGVRVSADGSHLVFVSAESLAGYDNADAADGSPDMEIYLYDTQGDHLSCISCNPTGARPSGQIFASENDAVVSRRISAQLPAGQNQLFTPRALSADGSRLFFDSFEALVARDTNGKADVYEWQRASSQVQCDENGAELFVPGSGGCLSLISTGQSPSDSELADISPDGHDVFIRTSSSLLPQDPGQVDVYDARVNGGMPQPPAQPAACEGEACQGPLSAPNDPTPASSAFEGAGNVTEAKTTAKKKKAHKKKKAKKHQKKAKHSRRAGR